MYYNILLINQSQ